MENIMNWNTSEVMSEFLKIASKDENLNKVVEGKDDAKTIEEKRMKSPEKNIVEVAHPKPVYVAESRGEGGLVENLLEQHKRLVEIVNKMPTGQHVGRYAKMISDLVKLADHYDSNGECEAADLLTSLASELIDSLELPLEEAPADAE
jgi:hypothetical protein